MLLLHTTNRNYQKHVAYQFVPFQMTLNDLGDHSPVAGFFFKCNSTIIYATFCTVLTDTLRRAVHRRQFSYTCTLNSSPLKKVSAVATKKANIHEGRLL